jgi:DNA-binding GntR family transcriptional regulator
MSNDTLSATTRADRLTRQLSEAITTGELIPGERLTEHELLARFGTTRGPLREALRRLEERQLLARLPYCGVRVIELTDDAVNDFYEVREALEGLVCRKVAERITDAEIAELRNGLKLDRQGIASIKSGADLRPWAIGDFHIRLAQIAGNRELIKILSAEIWRLLRVNYRRQAVATDRMERGNQAHERIVDALEQRDGELADLLMRRHIADSRRVAGTGRTPQDAVA